MEPAYARVTVMTMMTSTFESAIHIRFSRGLLPSDAVDHLSNMLPSPMITSDEMAQYPQESGVYRPYFALVLAIQV
jgi:hypothetical protein